MQERDQKNIILINEDNPQIELRNTTRKNTNVVQIDKKELNEIKLENMPKSLRTQIALFKLLHYLLLVVAICSIIYRRKNEIRDILEAQKKDQRTQQQFFLISSLIYVKYNLEILNFVLFIVFLTNLAETSKFPFIIKLVAEVSIIIFMISKITLYLYDLNSKLTLMYGLTISHLILEIFLLFLHFFIIYLYCYIRRAFLNNKSYRKIFTVFYMKNKLHVEN